MKYPFFLLVFSLVTGCRMANPNIHLDGMHEDSGYELLTASERKELSRKCRPYDNGNLTGDDLLTIVNKERGNQLTSDYEPTDLKYIPYDYVGRKFRKRNIRLRQETLANYLKLADKARSQGHILHLRSGFRSFDTQCYVFLRGVRKKSEEIAKMVNAEPGRSQHQLGTTVDITLASKEYGLVQSLADTDEFEWLLENSYKYGFVLSYPMPKPSEQVEGLPPSYNRATGYTYEPWHFRFIGIINAYEMKFLNLTLEEYLKTK